MRSTDPDTLAQYKASEVTNDELCLIRGIDQSDDTESTESVEGYATESGEEADG